MKLLIISGTPKKDGITHSFVEKAKETAEVLGVGAEVLRLAGMNLDKCKMCGDGWGTCYGKHTCAFGEEDGFNETMKKMQDADAYVYITPVYWGGVSEEMRIFLDKLRRCQATKQWDANENEKSFLIGKPSILVAVAGGGGGGTVQTFEFLERAITHMGGNERPRDTAGVYDYIAVNRWNQEYKRKAFEAAIKAMVGS